MKNLKYNPSIEELGQKIEIGKIIPKKNKPLALSIEEAIQYK